MIVLTMVKSEWLPWLQLETYFFLAFGDRETIRRIISLRRATRREFNHYVEAIKEGQLEDADN
jgi:hypothetical protein